MPDNVSNKPAPAAAATPARPAAGGGNAADRFMAEAKKFVGKPYQWGGGHGGQTGANQNVDCSGLVMQAYRMAGLGNGMDGTAQTQFARSKPVPLDVNALQPGDLVFRDDGSEMGHVGIYIGDGKVLHAGDPVQVQQGLQGFTHAGRIFDEAGQPLDTSDVPVGQGSAAAAGGPGGSRDSNGVGGGGRASNLSLPSVGGPGGASGSAGAAPSRPGSGSGVAKGDFGALMKKLEGMGIDRAYLEELAKKYGVSVEMILAVIMQESGGNPDAVSPAGAQGLMQLMPGTAAGLGVTDPFDPKQNLEGGVKYLSQMLQLAGGDETLAFAKYNAGPNGNPNNPETQKYMQMVPELVKQARAALNGSQAAAA